MIDQTVGFAVCGSFCTHAKAMEALEQVKARFSTVIPIVSECTAATDTRFGPAHELMREMERICDRRVISSIREAEPIGPKKLLDLLIIAPCTGNTLGKLACGITDTAVTMAAKAHLRNQRPLRTGRPGEKAHLPGGRLFSGGRRGSGSPGGSPAAASAAGGLGKKIPRPRPGNFCILIRSHDPSA